VHPERLKHEYKVIVRRLAMGSALMGEEKERAVSKCEGGAGWKRKAYGTK